MSVHDEIEPESENMASQEEIEAEDFERTPRPVAATTEYVREVASNSSMAPAVNTSIIPRRMMMSRTGSMATVRLQRRARLAEKLKDVFELKDIDEVWAEMPCWLLRSVCGCLFNI